MREQRPSARQFAQRTSQTRELFVGLGKSIGNAESASPNRQLAIGNRQFQHPSILFPIRLRTVPAYFRAILVEFRAAMGCKGLQGATRGYKGLQGDKNIGGGQPTSKRSQPSPSKEPILVINAKPQSAGTPPHHAVPLDGAAF